MPIQQIEQRTRTIKSTQSICLYFKRLMIISEKITIVHMLEIIAKTCKKVRIPKTVWFISIQIKKEDEEEEEKSILQLIINNNNV